MKRAIVLIVLLAMILSGCASAAATQAPAAGRDFINSGVTAPEAAPQEADYSDEYLGTGAGDAAPRRLVIQNADMSFGRQYAFNSFYVYFSIFSTAAMS